MQCWVSEFYRGAAKSERWGSCSILCHQAGSIEKKFQSVCSREAAEIGIWRSSQQRSVCCCCINVISRPPKLVETSWKRRIQSGKSRQKSERYSKRLIIEIWRCFSAHHAHGQPKPVASHLPKGPPGDRRTFFVFQGTAFWLCQPPTAWCWGFSQLKSCGAIFFAISRRFSISSSSGRAKGQGHPQLGNAGKMLQQYDLTYTRGSGQSRAECLQVPWRLGILDGPTAPQKFSMWGPSPLKTWMAVSPSDLLLHLQNSRPRRCRSLNRPDEA